MSVVYYFTFVMIAVISGLIVFLLVIYPKKYKAKVNRALQSGRPVKTIEPTILFGGISLITLIVLNIVLLVSINNMSDDIRNLQNSLNNSTTTLSYVQMQLSNTRALIDEMVQEDKWVKSSEYSIEAFHPDSTVDLNVVFELNRVPNEGTITLVYKDSSNTVLTQVVDSTTTIFSTIITLDSDEDYELSLMIDDGTITENEDLFQLNVMDRLSMYRQFYIDLDQDDYRFMTITLINDYSLYSELAFDEVELVIYLDDVVVDSVLFEQPDSDVNNVQQYVIDASPFSYGVGEVRVLVRCTDLMGNEFEFLAEEWTVHEEQVVLP